MRQCLTSTGADGAGERKRRGSVAALDRVRLIMKAMSTKDVSLDELRRFGVDIGVEFRLEVDEGQAYLLSSDPPSWVVLLAQADWWAKLLAGYSALFVAELVKEAAKDTWKSRARAVDAFRSVGGLLIRLAEGIVGLRRRLPARTSIVIGLSTPTEFDSTRLTIEGGNVDEVIAQLALFVHHLPAAVAFIESEQLNRTTVATAVILSLLEDGSLRLWWQERETLEERTHVISLVPTAV